MTNVMETFEKEQIQRLISRKRIPAFRSGDTMKVILKIVEGERSRLQIFEGVDTRVIDSLGFEQISIGDYVLAGGEVAAQVLVEGCVRLLPGVLGHSESVSEESFSENLLEYPQYTRPQVWVDANGNKHRVPDILVSGHHEKIKEWRKNKSFEVTKKFRPDLLKKLKGKK